MMLAKHASHGLSAKLIKNAKACQGLNTHTHKHTRAFTLIKSNQYQGHLSNTLFSVFCFPPEKSQMFCDVVEREGNLKTDLSLSANSAIY